MTKTRANRGVQRFKVFQKRVEILLLIDQGATQALIRERLDLVDVPPSTFQYLVTKLKNDPRPAMTNVAPVAQAPVPSSAPAPAQPVATKTKQPERESSEEKPKRKPARKKRKYVDGNAKYEKELGKSKLPRWDPAEAKNIK